MKTGLKYLYILFFVFLSGCGIFAPLKKTKTTEIKTIKLDTVIYIEPSKNIQKDFIKVENFFNGDTLTIETEKIETKVFLNDIKNKVYPNNTIIAVSKEKGFLLPVTINEKIITKSKTVERKRQKYNFKDYIFFGLFIVFGSLMIIHSYKIIK